MSKDDRRRALTLAAGALAFIAAGVLVGVLIGNALSPADRLTIWGESAQAIRYDPAPGDSEPFQQRMRRLRNELPYRSSWTDGDAAFLVDLMDRDLSTAVHVPEDAPAPERREALETVIETTFAILIASHALGAGVEMSDDARADIEAMLLSYLEHPLPRYRQLAVGAMVDSGMIRQDAVYHWVNDIAANDPDKETRELAAFELNYFDELMARRAAERRAGDPAP